jgi:hypothetical protein
MMKHQRKRASKISSRLMETPFQLSMILDLLGLSLATAVAAMSWCLVPPRGLGLWGCKIAEIGGVGAAGAAVLEIFRDFYRQRRIKRRQRLVRKCARAHGIGESEYVSRQIQRVLEPVRELAGVLKIDCTYVRHGEFRHTVDFSHGLLDYIDVFVEDYRMGFQARFKGQDVAQIFELSLRSQRRLAVVGDYNHIGPVDPIRIDEQGIRKLQIDLLLAIFLPAVLVHGSYIS